MPSRASRPTALVRLLLLVCAAALLPPSARADEAELEKLMASATKSEVKLLSSELKGQLKQLLAELKALQADFADGLVTPNEAVFEFGVIYATALRLGVDLMDTFEDGDQLVLGACLDELENVPTGLQPGGCGIRDFRRLKQDKALQSFALKAEKAGKKFAKGMGKLGVRFAFQQFPLPQPPQAGVDLDLGVTTGLVKPTAIVSLVSMRDDGTQTGLEPSSGVGVVAIADPANAASLDVLLQDAEGKVVDQELGVTIGPDCDVSVTFEDMQPGAYVVVLLHGGFRVTRAVFVG